MSGWNNKDVNRRKYLLAISTLSVTTIAGCNGSNDNQSPNGGNEETETSDDGEETEQDNGQSVSTDNNEENQEEGQEGGRSIFAEHNINQEDLVVKITDTGRTTVDTIELETPTEKQSVDVAETIDTYEFNIIGHRAGTWYIKAIDSGDDIIETFEIDTTFDLEVDEIGTLAQLGVTGESPIDEQMNWQIKLKNTGNIPIYPDEINVNAPNWEEPRDPKIQWGGSNSGVLEDGIVDQNEGPVIAADSTKTYRALASGAMADLFVVFTNLVEDFRGESFDIELVVTFEADREDTIIPVVINFGSEVEGRVFGNVVFKGSTIELREI